MKEMYYINDIHVDVNLYKYENNMNLMIKSIFKNIQYDSILILGGDYSNSFELFSKFIEEISKVSNEIYMVLGNHDYYIDNDIDNEMFNKSSYKKLCYIQEYLKKFSNITLLKGFEVFLTSNGHSIAGDTFWYNPLDTYSSKDTEYKSNLMDFEAIKDYDISYNHLDGIHLFNKINSLNPLDIVVTHVPPIITNSNNRLGCYGFTNPVPTLKSKIHLFGHVHEIKEYEYKGCNLVTNCYTHYGKPIKITI